MTVMSKCSLFGEKATFYILYYCKLKYISVMSKYSHLHYFNKIYNQTYLCENSNEICKKKSHVCLLVSALKLNSIV